VDFKLRGSGLVAGAPKQKGTSIHVAESGLSSPVKIMRGVSPQKEGISDGSEENSHHILLDCESGRRKMVTEGFGENRPSNSMDRGRKSVNSREGLHFGIEMKGAAKWVH